MNGDTYLLSRDTEESERLNEQHRIFSENNGYVIHPLIVARLPSEARIADVAAGSGAWTLDAARQFPEAQVDAYDISDDQFPPGPPPNTSFSVHDAKEAFPGHLHGAYDVVHVRALVAALDPSDWQTVIANLKQILKPGGTLQWSEADLGKAICLRGGASAVQFDAVPRVLALFFETAKQRITYGARELPELLTGAGFGSLQTDWVSSDRVAATRTALTATYLIALLGWAKRAGALGDDELERLRLRCQGEVADGAYIRADMLTVTGIN